MRMRFKDDRAFEKRGKDFVDFARSYLSEAFPNPDCQGCPPDTALRSLAFNPMEAELALTEHLAACSPCFKRYSELLTELKFHWDMEKGFSWGKISVWTKAHPGLAGAMVLCLLLIAIGAGFLLRDVRQPNTTPIDAHRKPSPEESGDQSVAYLPFSLDLSASSPIRGRESPAGTHRPISVPNSPLDLTINLPLASPEGPYDLKLIADGQTFWSKPVQAHLQKGKTLIHVETDFTQIRVGNYSVEIRSSSGIRFIQQVVISRSARDELVRRPAPRGLGDPR